MELDIVFFVMNLKDDSYLHPQAMSTALCEASDAWLAF